MANSYIYPAFSFISFIWLFLALNKPISIPKYPSILFFFIMSMSWCLFANFNGTDMPEYLHYFSVLNFNNLALYGVPNEFTVALFPSLLKATFSISDEYILMIAHRVFTFSFIPSAILLFVKNRSNFLPIFTCCIVFVFLLPYSFLSLVNIITNGFSLSLLCFSLLLILPFLNLHCSDNNHRYLLQRNVFVAILLFLSCFAHGYGTVSVFLLIIGGIFIGLLSYLRIITFKRKFSSLLFTSLLILPLCFVVSVFLFKLLSSTYSDSTILISCIICSVTIYLSRNMFNLYAPSCLNHASYIHFRSKVNFLWYLLFCLSFISVALGVFGGGDAAERFVAGSINLNILFFIYYGVHYRSNYQLRSLNINSPYLSSTVIPFLNFCILFILLVMNVYFYNSTAFLSNI